MLKATAAAAKTTEEWEAKATEEWEAEATKATEAAKAIEAIEATKAVEATNTTKATDTVETTEATDTAETTEATEATAQVTCGSGCRVSRNAGMSALGKGASSKERQAQNQAQNGGSSDFTHVCH